VAGADKAEFPALLPAGFHPMDMLGLRRLAVVRFSDSFTRPAIMTHLEQVVERINASGIRGEIWVDGSFLTEKLNPEDVDVLLAVDAGAYAAMSPAQKMFFRGFQAVSLFPTHHCDNYAAVIDATRPDGEWLHAYWLRQFGFSRADEMKGIVTIHIPFLVTP
jgi:hypothetical protein